MAKTSYNQLLLMDRFCCVYAHQDLFASCHNVAMSLYNITDLNVHSPLQAPVVRQVHPHTHQHCSNLTTILKVHLSNGKNRQQSLVSTCTYYTNPRSNRKLYSKRVQWFKYKLAFSSLNNI